jgi:hypothetical protein
MGNCGDSLAFTVVLKKRREKNAPHPLRTTDNLVQDVHGTWSAGEKGRRYEK